MMGAHHIVGVDVDQDALDLAWVNMNKLEIENLDLIKCDLNGGLLKSSKTNIAVARNIYMTVVYCVCVCVPLRISVSRMHVCNGTRLMLFIAEFDTVVMNPPFGTRNTGIDTVFLLNAMKISNVVYSLHKTSTREVCEVMIMTSLGMELCVDVSVYVCIYVY